MGNSAGSGSAVVHGVVGVLADGDRFLVIRRAPHILAGGAWCFPGGAIEPGETPVAALIREMREEVGLAVRPVREVWECTLNDGLLRLFWWLVEPVQAGQYGLRLNADEVAEARWLTPAEILALPGLLESNRVFLRRGGVASPVPPTEPCP